MNRVDESAMAVAVKAILLTQPRNGATFAELRELVPGEIVLSRADRAPRKSRPGEPMWMQIVRNLIVHHRQGFSHIPRGIRLIGTAHDAEWEKENAVYDATLTKPRRRYTVKKAKPVKVKSKRKTKRAA